MTRETVEREIARLEALSRARALDDHESWRLQKLITTERRYNHAGSKHAEAGR